MKKKKDDFVCDVCGGYMDPFDRRNYYCEDCGRHMYLYDDGHVDFDDDDDPDWMGKDDIDWDDVFDI